MDVSFFDLGIDPGLVRILTEQGIEEPFEVQRETIPDSMLGNDICCRAPTGSGKTTIISLLSRLYEVTSGKILINKHEIKEISLQSLRNQIGLVFQEPFLFSGTIYENISFGKKNASDKEVIDILNSIGGDNFINNLPNGIHTEIAERGRGGEGEGSGGGAGVEAAILEGRREVLWGL